MNVTSRNVDMPAGILFERLDVVFSTLSPPIDTKPFTMFAKSRKPSVRAIELRSSFDAICRYESDHARYIVVWKSFNGFAAQLLTLRVAAGNLSSELLLRI
jgi:hypothetical protein